MSFFEYFKNTFSLNSDIEDETQDDIIQDDNDEESKFLLKKPKFMSINTDNISKIENPYTSNGVEVIKYEPTEYFEAKNVVDSLINKKIVVINFANMKPNVEEGKDEIRSRDQIFDFLAGAIYAMGGGIEMMSDTIFVMTPPGVRIDSSINREFDRRRSYGC